MNRLKSEQILATFIFSALCVQFFAFGINAHQGSGNGQSNNAAEENRGLAAKYKIAPDLEEQTNDLMFGRQVDGMQKVIIQLKSETPLNEMFGNSMNADQKKKLLATERFS